MESEERSRVGTEEFCGLRGSCCGGLKGSFCGGSSIDTKSHMQMFLDTLIDVRRMYESKYIYKSSHTLSQIVVDESCKPLDHFLDRQENIYQVFVERLVISMQINAVGHHDSTLTKTMTTTTTFAGVTTV